MSKLKKRAAAFFYAPHMKPGFVPVPIGGGLMGYVRGALTPKGTSLIGVLHWAHTSLPGSSRRYPADECFMNGHFVTAKAKSAAIYIAVRGGVVQGVRYRAGVGTPVVLLVDYDNRACDGNKFWDEEEFERSGLAGKTWDEIEQDSEGVF